MPEYEYYCCCREKGWKTFKGLVRHLKELHPCAFYGIERGEIAIVQRTWRITNLGQVN